MKYTPRKNSPKIERLLSDRRRFLSGIGITAGAGFLFPLADKLLAEAQAAPLPRLRVIFMALGNGWPHASFDPVGLTEGRRVSLASEFTDRGWLEPLQKYRSSIVQVSRLKNDFGQTQHGAGFQMLSCVPTMGAAEHGGAPGGITFDQVIAQQIGASTAVASALFGIDTSLPDTNARGIFASDSGVPEPIIQSPDLFYSRLFGNVPTSSGEKERLALRNQTLFDTLKADIKRLEANFVGEEKEKLERYLAAVQRHQVALSAFSNLSCDAPPSPNLLDDTYESRLALLNDMATTAMMCGITHVVGSLSGHNNSHEQFPGFSNLSARPGYEGLVSELKTAIEADVGTNGEWDASAPINGAGHGTLEAHSASMSIIYRYHMELLARSLEQLEQTPEDSGTMLDNTLVIVSNEGADHHHNACTNWPVMIFAGKNIPLNSGGRFIQAPDRNLADLWVTVGRAVGVDMTDFAEGSPRPFTQEIAEVLA